MARILCRILLAWLLVLACCADVDAAGKDDTKPNILFICVDDLKPVLGCYGDPIARTPHLDRLAASGLLFDRAYCNQAVCSPSRNSLLTGVRPSTLGIYDLGTNFRQVVPGAVTLPQHFKAQGYRTEALGKIFHVGHGNHEDPASWSVPHWQAKSIAYVLPESKPKNGITREEALFANQPAGNKPRGAAFESADVDDEAYPDGKIAAEAVARLQAAKKHPDTPFFLAVGFVKPHLPFCAPKKYWDLYSRDDLPLAKRRMPPDGAPSYAPQFGGELRQYAGIPEKGDIPEDLQRTLIHGYYAAVSYMDAQLGRVLDELDRLALSKNTIVVLWGDHGWHLGDHGMWCKHTNYEQAARIPLIVVAPGVTRPNSRSSSLVETVDLYPTLCDLASLPTPSEPLRLEGKSLVPVLRDSNTAVKDHVLHVYPRGERIGRAIRTAQYRLVEWKKPAAAADTAEYELYDYEADPLETRNLASERPEIVSQLSKLLSQHPEAMPQFSARAPAKINRAELFRRKDADGDGTLTRAEFLANQPDPDKAPARFLTFDKDQNGTLSREEFVRAGK